MQSFIITALAPLVFSLASCSNLKVSSNDVQERATTTTTSTKPKPQKRLGMMKKLLYIKIYFVCLCDYNNLYVIWIPSFFILSSSSPLLLSFSLFFSHQKCFFFSLRFTRPLPAAVMWPLVCNCWETPQQVTLIAVPTCKWSRRIPPSFAGKPLRHPTVKLISALIPVISPTVFRIAP